MEFLWKFLVLRAPILTVVGAILLPIFAWTGPVNANIDNLSSTCSETENILNAVFRSAGAINEANVHQAASTHAALLSDSLSKLNTILAVVIESADRKNSNSPELSRIAVRYGEFLSIYQDEGLEKAKAFFGKHLVGQQYQTTSADVSTFKCFDSAAGDLNAPDSVRDGFSDQLARLFAFDFILPDYRVIHREAGQLIRDRYVMFFVVVTAMLPAAMILVDWLDNRKDRRFDVYYPSVAASPHGTFPVDIVNISASGARFESDREIKINERLFLTLEAETVVAQVVWAHENRFGVKFAEKISKSVLKQINAAKASA